MKASFVILIMFFLGALIGHYVPLPDALNHGDYTLAILLVLMFFIGFGMGYDKKAMKTMRDINPKFILVPIGTLLGTLIAVGLTSLILPYSLGDTLALGSGMGYYSVSSLIIKSLKAEALGPAMASRLGTIALLSNIIRELSAVVLTPILVKKFGPFAPISAAGVTSIDVALPSIRQYSGEQYAVVAIFHGLFFELSVPFLVPFFCSL